MAPMNTNTAEELMNIFKDERNYRTDEIADVTYLAVDAGAVDPEDLGYLIGAVIAFVFEDVHQFLCGVGIHRCHYSFSCALIK